MKNILLFFMLLLFASGASIIKSAAATGGGGRQKVLFVGDSFFDASLLPTRASGAAKEDTIRIVSRDKLFPNSAALVAGYMVAADTVGAVINQGTAGQGVKWGHVYKGSASTVYYDASAPYQNYILRATNALREDDHAIQSSNYVGFIWVSANGLKAGYRVESASLMFNVAAYESFIVPSNGFFAVRLDTITADYAMVATTVAVYGADTDTSRMDISYNEVDASGNKGWAPALDARQDRHDFGPRSDNVIGPGTYAAGTCLPLNVTDAVQQALDNAVADPTIITRGFIFMLYGSVTQTDSPTFSAGDYEGYVGRGTNKGNGCPTFKAVTTSKRGPKAWGSGDVPFVMTFDDDWDAHVGYADAMWAAGRTFTAVTYNSGFVGNASYDSLLSPNLSRTTIVHHSSNHPGIGGLTGSSLNEQVTRSTYYTGSAWTNPPGNAAVQHYAWPVDGVSQIYGLPAVSMMIDHGYLSSRAASVKADSTSPVGSIRYLSWDNVSNIYLVGSLFATAIFQNGGNPAAWAYIREEMTDAIDACYTNYGKGALVVYAHKASDGITTDNLTIALAVADTLNCTQAMDYADVVSRRLSGSAFLDPATITEANGYTFGEETTAARYDSLRTANDDDNMLRVWIAPK